MSLIFGTYRLKGEVLGIATSQALHAMTQAGITSPIVDTALMYNNEPIVRQAIAKHPNVLVGSKVHRPHSIAADIASQVAAYGDRLHRLILHKHMPFEAYLELVKAKAAGQVAKIGVSNYTATELKQLVSQIFAAPPESLPLPAAQCVPDLIQNEFHPFLRTTVPQTCKELGIRFEAHSVFSYLELYPAELCAAASLTPPQLALGFALQRGMGDVVFQTSNYLHLQQNLEPVTLSSDVLAALDNLVNSKCHARYAGSDSPALALGLPNYLDPTHVWFEDCPAEFIRDVLAQTLREDAEKLRKGLLPSKTANAVTKFRAKNPKSVAAFKALSEGFFGPKPIHEDPVKDFDSKCKKLDSTLTALRKALLDHETAMAAQAKPKVCKFKALENPEALPVDIPDPAVLQPFIDLVATSKALPETAIRMERGTLFPDGRMDFCKQVSQPSFEKLCAAVLTSGVVKHFLIGNNVALADDTTGSREAALTNLIKLSSGIQTWYLAGNAISKTQIASIAEALAEAQDARYVWLKMNPIKTGSAHLGHLLRRNLRLELLDLFNTGLCDDGMAAFADALEGFDGEGSQMRHLYFDINAITNGETVARAATKFPLLESLSVNVNQLGDAGVAVLCDALIRARTPLQRIVLGSNGCTDESLRAVTALVRATPSLVIVQLGSYKSTRFFQQRANRFTDAAAMEELGRVIIANAMGTATPAYHYLGFDNAYVADDAPQLMLTLGELGLNANGSQLHQKDLVTATAKQLNQILGTPYNVQPAPVEYIQSVYRNAM